MHKYSKSHFIDYVMLIQKLSFFFQGKKEIFKNLWHSYIIISLHLQLNVVKLDSFIFCNYSALANFDGLVSYNCWPQNIFLFSQWLVLRSIYCVKKDINELISFLLKKYRYLFKKIVSRFANKDRRSINAIKFRFDIFILHILSQEVQISFGMKPNLFFNNYLKVRTNFIKNIFL